MPRRANDALQEQLAAARRNQILDAATTVFAEKGFARATIKDVAQTAGIADGTIYIYFQNKTAVLLGIFDRMRETALQAEDTAQFDAADVRSFIKAYLYRPLTALKAHNFGLFRVVISEMMVNQELRELYYQKILKPTINLAEPVFQSWADQHLIKSVNISLLTRVLSGMVFGLMLEHIMGDPTLNSQWDDLPDFLADLIMNGLKTDQS